MECPTRKTGWCLSASNREESVMRTCLLAVAAARSPQSDASPDFLVSVYGPSLMDVNVPADAPPLFVAVGSTHFTSPTAASRYSQRGRRQANRPKFMSMMV